MGRTIDPNEHAGDMNDTYAQPLPGVYFAKFEDIAYKEKNDKSGEYCNAKIRVLEAELGEGDEEDPKKFANSVIWDMLFLTDKAIWKISEASVSAGNNAGWDVDSEAQTKRQLEGRVIKIRTKMDEYEGVKSAKVAKYLKVSPEERQRFASQHKPAGGGSNAGLPDGPMPSGGQAPVRPSSDDIPF